MGTDEQHTAFAETQIDGFGVAISGGHSLGPELPTDNLAHSAGIMRYSDARFDMVRPGIMLYGALPCPDLANPPIPRHLMTFCSSVLQVREAEPGTPISYGRRGALLHRQQKLLGIAA